MTELIPLVCEIVNAALLVGMPDHHKHAIVTPLIKKKGLDKNNFSNYRPVSNLSTLSKLIEKVVSLRLIEYFEAQNMNDDNQCAYRKGYSCEMALIAIHDYVLRAMDDGKVVALLLFDMSSAFDTVDHRILMERIHTMGIEGTAYQWMVNYLENRTQSVRIDGVDSESLRLMHGVPQGSVLGPLLFSLYIRPLGTLIQQHGIDYKLYADDLQLYYSFRSQDVNEAVDKLEKCAFDVNLWLLHNKLSLNASKSELILLGSRQQLSKMPGFSIRLGESVLLRKAVVRNLGALVDENMTFEQHVNTVSRNALYYLRIIARNYKYLTRHDVKMLVCSLVISRIDYCCSLLVGIKRGLMDKLERVVKSALRIISKCGGQSDENGAVITSAELRIRLRALTIVWLALNGRVPPFVSEWFQVSSSGGMVLRSEAVGLLSVPRMRTESGKRAFGVFASTLWNKIPEEIRSSTSQDNFRQLCLQFLSTFDDR